MINQIKQVEEFHTAFNHPVADDITILDTDRANLRYDLIHEELREYGIALDNKDVKEQLDALTDMLYVIFGAIIESGFQDYIILAFDEVHRSNMSKLEDGKPLYREDGKVLKGSNYKKPNLKAVMEHVHGVKTMLDYVAFGSY